MATLLDPSSSSTTTIILRKRRHRNSLVIHLSSPSSSCENDPAYVTESEYDVGEGPQDGILPTRRSSILKQKPYICTFEGCTKAYTKRARLGEHERSHTGERPYVCSVCNKSYLRETHLQAHRRTHLPSSARPFLCEEPGCGKRFWTSQHLRVHTELHRGEKSFKCTEANCDAAFAKHHQLREHICTVHSPPGTKPYRCEHAGCTKSFATNQKLTAHIKTHDGTRYTCAHQSCLPAPGESPTYYQTWSALQHHMRTAHPPTCPYQSCKGKTFTLQKGLRAHMKIHAQRDQEAELVDAIVGFDDSEAEAEAERPRKRRRGGEVGRDWVCEVDGCDKDFKSKKALATHHNIAHLGRRDFVCPHEHCQRAFGYKHLLQRHLAKLHASSGSDHGSSDEDEQTEPESLSVSTQDVQMDIDFLTGKTYAAQAREAVNQVTKLQCPYPHLPPILSVDVDASEPVASSSKRTHACQYVFSRAYDLRRHLQAEHGVEVERDKVDEWVRGQKDATTSAVA
ncbi:hypothetical protein C8Q74DRAFT_1207337 [Fomes fomentarius]|nr:hypothetical protein C8Q74DRAFT_1207337 [Fomes fomentarius]